MSGGGEAPASADGPLEWPDDSAEASYLSENPTRAPAPAAPIEKAPAGAAEKLPELDHLVGRVPKQVLSALDDLFRVRFTTVRRYTDN